MKIKVLFLFFIILMVHNIYAQDISVDLRDSKRKAIIEFIAGQIESSKADYPALADFSSTEMVKNDSMAGIEFKGKNAGLILSFGSVYNSKNSAQKVTGIFFIEETRDYILCNISGTPEIVDRLNGIFKSIPAVQSCSPNVTNGDWDNCQYMI